MTELSKHFNSNNSSTYEHYEIWVCYLNTGLYEAFKLFWASLNVNRVLAQTNSFIIWDHEILNFQTFQVGSTDQQRLRAASLQEGGTRVLRADPEACGLQKDQGKVNTHLLKSWMV